MSNEFIIGWCAAGSFYAMADKKWFWSVLNLALAFGVALWR